MDNIPENETPEIVKTTFDSVTELLSAYGWTILFFLVIANLLWSHIRPKFRKWRERIEEQKQASVYHENPNLFIERQEAIARARQRLQDAHDRLAREKAEKAKEQEEQKRQEKITKWEQMQTGKSSLGSSSTQPRPGGTSSGNNLREGYNPLMNPGGGVCYRPSRRGGGGGGG